MDLGYWQIQVEARAGITCLFSFEFFGGSPNIGVFLEFARNNWEFGTYLEHFRFEIRLTNGQEIFLLGGES